MTDSRNPLRFLNPLRPVMAWLEHRPWLRRFLIALPFLLILSLLAPVLTFVEKLLDIIARILGPMLETSLGRSLLLVITVAVLLLLVYVFAKERVLGLFRRYVLAVHLRAIEELLLGKKDAARSGFRRVVRYGRWLDLSKGEAKLFGSLLADARIKLARLALEEGDPVRARGELARISSQDAKKRLALSIAELNARIFIAHPDHLAASVRQELEHAHEAWPGHLGIARMLARHLQEAGEEAAAADVLERCAKKSPKALETSVHIELARFLLEMARSALHAGRLKDAREHLKRSLRLDESEEGRLLEADVHLAGEDLEASLRVLEEIEGPAAKERLAELLRRADVPLGPRDLLERVPRRDILLTLAQHWLDSGEHRKAGRALEICLREGMTTPRVLILLAALELAEKREERAAQTLRLAFRELEGH